MSVEPSYAVNSSRITPAVITEGATRKEFLPRRSGESRFAPPQYFYSASKSAALPIAADLDEAHAMQPAA